MRAEKSGRIYDLSVTIKLNAAWWSGFCRGIGSPWERLRNSMDKEVRSNFLQNKIPWGVKIVEENFFDSRPFQLEYQILEKHGHGWLKLITPPTWVNTGIVKEAIKSSLFRVMSA